jgi:hypothetical protein
MNFLKKWGLIAGIFFGSFIALSIIAILLEKYAGLDIGGSIVGIYVAIFGLWCIFIILKTMFKSSSFLMRRYYLFLAKIYFKKKYPQVNLSDFSTMRLYKMCNVKVRFPNLDIPLLDDKELDRLNTETNLMNAKSVAKASWWVTKNTAKATWWATKTTAKVTLKTAGMAGATMNAAGSGLNSLSGANKAGSDGTPYKSGYTTSNEATISRLEFEIAMYEKKYEEGMSSPNAGDRKYAIEIHLPMIEERKRDLKHWREQLKFNQNQDSFHNKN